LLTTSSFTVHTFGVLLAVAYLSALGWLVRSSRQAGVSQDEVLSLGLWAIVGAIVGAKALMALRSFSEYAAAPSHLWPGLLTNAGDFYGGFLGAVVASAVFFRRHRTLAFWLVADLCAPAIALGQGIGRIGCFMAGDDYGKATTVAWAVRFSDPDASWIGGAPLGVPVHPVQLYESAACFGLFMFLLWLRRRQRLSGDLILAYTGLYAAIRFWLEMFRGDADRGFLFDGLLSTSQFIGIAMMSLSVVLLVRRHRGRLGWVTRRAVAQS
jgi:phosphatidylglycerol:prolipoprotein diacylglycerol transferase